MKLFILVFFFCLVAMGQGKEIRVMIIDTGVSSKIPQLKKYLAKDNQAFDIFDKHGHGTHVTGSILYGPKLNNPVCSNVKIYSCKFLFDGSKMGSADCFHRARKLSMDFVNFSGGGREFWLREFFELLILTQTTKVVVAAGNNGTNLLDEPYYPAAYNMKNIDVVGNGTSPSKRAKTSNFGLNDMIWLNGQEVKSFGIDKKYEYMNGSSQATALRTHELLLEACKKIGK